MPILPPSRKALIVAAVLMAISIPVTVASAADAATVSTTAGGLTYTADDTNVAAGATVTSYDGATTTVAIADHVTIGAASYAVTAIAANVFSGSNVMTSVTIPNTVTTIGANAFAHLGKVTTIVIPDSVSTIGTFAFDSIDKLTSLTIGSGIAAIPTQAFSNANHLLSVTIPSSVTSIAFAAFAADDLRNVVIGSGVTTIGDSAFAFNNNLTTVTLPASITTIGSNVFQNNSSSGTFTATFQGPAPTIGSGDFAAHSPSVVFPWRFGSPQTAGGYSTPTWLGVTSTALTTTTYDANGHGTAPAAQDVLAGASVPAPASPSAPGFTFNGWFAAASGGTAVGFPFTAVTDRTLYAQWSPTAVVLPTITLSAGTVVSGGTILVTGSGFTPGASLDIVLHSTPVTLATVIASGSGAFSATVTIPAGTPAGAHSIAVGLVTLPLTVTDPARALGATGADATNEFVDGGELLLAGMLLLGFALWRRRTA
jgi:uncharacterized repeat protein (TIGR02543 family)